MQQIVDLLANTQIIRKKYGCDAFNELNVKSSTYKYELMARFKTSKWAIRDRGKFGLLISDVRSLVDSLMVELIGQRSRLKDCG
ncbi:unnamed protein product [Fusarium graminearum]|nr:unnamed protein product [Fusarium graminearum]